jgi:hypothetical protein
MMVSDAVRDLLLECSHSIADAIEVAGVEEAEAVAEELGRLVSGAVVQQLLKSTKSGSYQGSSIDCDCGAQARFMGYRKRKLVTTSGPANVEGAYYHCGECGTGQIPWDEAQGLNERQMTPTMKALVSELSAVLPYGQATRMVERLTGVTVQRSTAEHVVAEVGSRVREAEDERIEAALVGEVAPEASPERLIVQTDGTCSHIDDDWHEVKSAVVMDGEGLRRRRTAARERSDVFGERIYALAAEAGVEQADEVVAIGDGAKWIDAQFAHHFPNAIRVLDIWHAREHIWDVARAHYGEDSKKGKRWARRHCRRLKEEGPEPLLRALGALKPKTQEAAEVIRRERAYFRNRREQMQYPEFAARDIPLGSGQVEAACKVVVGQRLKCAGMRWSHDGADAVLALRCLVLDEQHQQIHKYSRAA